MKIASHVVPSPCGKLAQFDDGELSRFLDLQELVLPGYKTPQFQNYVVRYLRWTSATKAHTFTHNWFQDLSKNTLQKENVLVLDFDNFAKRYAGRT
jgi:hypothetical protein